MLGEITHPLERGGDAQGADDDAQVRSDGCLERDDVEALLLGLRGEDVYLLVGRDDFLGEAQVGVEQGLCGAVHG